MGTFEGRHALILAAAPETNYSYIRDFLQERPDAAIVCADGGLTHARALGLYPDLMIADGDSAPETAGVEVIRLKAEKDHTDSQACLWEVFKRGGREATLVCALGGRMDHTLANLSLPEEAHALGGHLTVLDAQNRIEFHAGGRQVYAMPKAYQYFSIIPLDAVLTGVTIEGAKYPLDGVTLTRAGMVSVSNEALTDTFSVTITTGRALLVFSRD